MKSLGVGIGGERMEVGNEETAVIVILHSYKFAQRSEIVAQMKIAGRPDSAKHNLFIAVFFHILLSR